MIFCGKPLWLVLAGQIADMKSHCFIFRPLSQFQDYWLDFVTIPRYDIPALGLHVCVLEGAILFSCWLCLPRGSMNKHLRRPNKQTNTCHIDPLQVWTGMDVENRTTIAVIFRKRMTCFCGGPLSPFLFSHHRISPENQGVISHEMKLCYFSFSTVILCASWASLHDCKCLHWQYDWNKQIKPRWALLSKQSLRTSGWYGHRKYSRSTHTTVQVQLCVICLSFHLHFTHWINWSGSCSKHCKLDVFKLRVLL